MPLDGDAHPEKLGLRRAREAALACLSESFARDELSLDDFERRVDAAYAAGAERELEALVADLGAPSPKGLVVATAAAAVFGNVEVKTLPSRALLEAGVGAARLPVAPDDQ
jgi:Domain of unknown function (DUF1707)